MTRSAHNKVQPAATPIANDNMQTPVTTMAFSTALNPKAAGRTESPARLGGRYTATAGTRGR